MPHPNEDSKARQQPSVTVSLFSGAGIGLMVGALLGLANSPMVGVLAGAVGAGLAAVLGLNDAHFTAAKGLRIGAFGIAVALAAPAGLYARNHRLLHPSPATLADRKAEYLALGLEEEEVLNLLREWLSTTGAPSNDSSAARTRVAAAGSLAPPSSPAPEGAAVSARGVELANCRELVRLGDGMTVPQFVGALSADGPRWRMFADRVRESLSADDQKRALLFARDEVCPLDDEPAPPAPSVNQCRQLEVAVADPETEMQEAFANAGLSTLYGRITREISPAGQDDALALMVGVVCLRGGTPAG